MQIHLVIYQNRNKQSHKNWLEQRLLANSLIGPVSTNFVTTFMHIFIIFLYGKI